MADRLEKDAEVERTEPAPKAVLEESVSFGRFVGEPLSWERWSSFSQNKYMEEAEKCSTPGSVAKKKAYFEAHYKQIAARKAQLLEQEQQAEAISLKSDRPNFGDAAGNGWNSEFTDTELGRLDVENTSESKGQYTNSTDVESNAHVDEVEKDVVIVESQGPLDDGTKTELAEMLDRLEFDKSEVDASVEEEKCLMESEVPIELLKVFDDEVKRNEVSKPEDGKEKSPSKQSQKRTPAPPKGKNLSTTKKKAEISTPKLRNTRVPRASKPPPASPTSSTPKTSTRKNSSSLPSVKNASVTENKRSNPSLHMSLTISSIGTDSSPMTTSRRSLIMEKMGDKEIVRRAFKTFQNRFNLSNSPTDPESSIPQQESANGRPQSSPTMIPGKRNEGDRKAVEKASAQRKPVDARAPSVSTGPSKAAGGSKPVSRNSASSFSLRSDERAEKRREFLLKLEEKSSALEAERTQLRSKSKEMKEAEIKKLRQSLNFKATPMPSFYREHGISKDNVKKTLYEKMRSPKHEYSVRGHLGTDGTKNGSGRRLESHRGEERVPHSPQS